jgi:hypothetical protein
MRSQVFLLLILLIFILTISVASAEEKLILEPYPADIPWQEVTNKPSGGQWLRQQIPSDQKIETYKDILAAAAFPLLKDVSPAAFLKQVFNDIGAICEGTRVNGPKEHLDGGYSLAYAQIYCGKAKGTDFGVNMFYKVIKGTDALYIIKRDFRVPPSQKGGMISFPKDQEKQMMALFEAMSVADSYLTKSVYLCGEQSNDKRCDARNAK